MRKLALASSPVIVGLVLTAAACDSTNSVPDAPIYAGGAGGLSGGGIGDECGPQLPCRIGLGCDENSQCAAPGNIPVGGPCVASVECEPGLFCDLDHTCQKVGSGKVGDDCTLDKDCGDGLRCNVVGLKATCGEEGKGDVGDECKSGADCLGALACLQGTCGMPPIGVPAGLTSGWEGETCEEDTGAATAYFRVPRGKDDKDFYRLPFPNDIRLKNGKPDLTGHPTPGPYLTGVDPVDLYLRGLETESDKWGSFGNIYFRFSQGPSVDSLKNGNLVFVDITPGDTLGNTRGISFYASYGGSKYICANWLAVRPATGAPLTPGHTYAVYVTTNAAPKDGGKFQRADDFDAVMADSAPSDSALKAAHSAYAPFRSYLASQSINPDTVLTAAVFTAGNVRSTAESIASVITDAPAPAVKSWVKCGEGASPCSDATGDRACGGQDSAFDEYHALVSLPIFQQGTPPYETSDDGGNISVGSGLPASKDVCMSLTVPKGTMPASGWPVVVYAHGTGGDFRSHIREGVASLLASADSGAGTVGFAVMGIDQVEHGPRRGDTELGPDELFFNFTNPKAARGNPLQGAADQMSLARVAETLDLAASASPTGSEFKFDPANTYFWGHSQGATEGGIGAPYTKFKAVVLSGEGGSLKDALMTKSSPVDIAAALPIVFQDPAGNDMTKLAGGEHNPVLSILQMYIDPADPINFAIRMTKEPATGYSPHHVFQPFGLNDTYTPSKVQINYAAAGDLTLVDPAESLSLTDDDRFPGCPSESSCNYPNAPAPMSANITVDTVTYTAGVRQYNNSSDYDGHFVAFRNSNAKADIARFFAGAAQGAVPVIGK